MVALVRASALSWLLQTVARCYEKMPAQAGIFSFLIRLWISIMHNPFLGQTIHLPKRNYGPEKSSSPFYLLNY